MDVQDQRILGARLEVGRPLDPGLNFLAVEGVVPDRLRLDRPPVRKHPDDAGARPLRNLERATGEPRLIGDRIRGAEDILLPSLVERRRVGQHAFEDRRRDAQHAHAAALDPLAQRINLAVTELDDVLVADQAKFGPRHPDFGHRVERRVEVEGELVGNGGNRKHAHASHSRIQTHSVGILHGEFLQTPQVTRDGIRWIVRRLVLQPHISTESMPREHREDAIPVEWASGLAVVQRHLGLDVRADRVRDGHLDLVVHLRRTEVADVDVVSGYHTRSHLTLL